MIFMGGVMSPVFIPKNKALVKFELLKQKLLSIPVSLSFSMNLIGISIQENYTMCLYAYVDDLAERTACLIRQFEKIRFTLQ